MNDSSEKESFSKGVLFMLVGAVLFALADAFGKLATQNYPLSQVIWLRCFFGLLIIAFVITLKGDWSSFQTKRPGAHLARSIAGIFMTSCMLTGLKYIPLAEVTAVAFATPIIVAVYSTFILRESISRGMYMAITLGFIGVLIVVRPTPDHFHFAHLIMLGFALSSAFLSISARALVKTESPLSLNLSIYPAAILVVGFFAWRDWVNPDLLSLAYLFGVAFFASLALLSITKAVHCASPAKVVPFDYSRILWTVSMGWVFWDELPDTVTWVGIAIIMLCGIYIVRHGHKSVKEPEEIGVSS